MGRKKSFIMHACTGKGGGSSQPAQKKGKELKFRRGEIEREMEGLFWGEREGKWEGSFFYPPLIFERGGFLIARPCCE